VARRRSQNRQQSEVIGPLSSHPAPPSPLASLFSLHSPPLFPVHLQKKSFHHVYADGGVRRVFRRGLDRANAGRRVIQSKHTDLLHPRPNADGSNSDSRSNRRAVQAGYQKNSTSSKFRSIVTVGFATSVPSQRHCLVAPNRCARAAATRY
jgi:hypothetical protein